MNGIEKIPLLNNKGVAVGVIFRLTGKIGYGTPDDEMLAFAKEMQEAEGLALSEIIVFDVTSLKRWDTLSLRQVFPRVEKINESLQKKGKIPIAFIGLQTEDPFDAAKERYQSVGTSQIPWFDTIEEFLRNYKL